MTQQKTFSKFGLIGLLALLPLSALPQTKLDAGVTASVTGQAIPQTLLDQVLHLSVAKGAQNSAELRRTILDETISHEVLAQEARRLKLDKAPAAQADLELMRQNYLAELAMNDYLVKNPVTEEAVRAEYDRQVKAIADQGDVKQYQPSVMVLASESEAKALLQQLRSGQAFEQLAREKSVDTPTRSNGGSMGWVLPGQIAPAIANVMVNLGKGALVNAPIQTAAGWVILRLDDVRPFIAPSFEDSKNQLRQMLAQQKVTELLRKLREAAKIVQP